MIKTLTHKLVIERSIGAILVLRKSSVDLLQMLLSQFEFLLIILALIFQLLQLGRQRSEFLLNVLCTCCVLYDNQYIGAL